MIQSTFCISIMLFRQPAYSLAASLSVVCRQPYPLYGDSHSGFHTGLLGHKQTVSLLEGHTVPK